jgi:hypothetical protein
LKLAGCVFPRGHEYAGNNDMPAIIGPAEEGTAECGRTKKAAAEAMAPTAECQVGS